jgi:hypothetical protein
MAREWMTRSPRKRGSGTTGTGHIYCELRLTKTPESRLAVPPASVADYATWLHRPHQVPVLWPLPSLAISLFLPKSGYTHSPLLYLPIFPERVYSPHPCRHTSVCLEPCVIRDTISLAYSTVPITFRIVIIVRIEHPSALCTIAGAIWHM